MARLLCTVRGCGRPLERDGRTLVCARGHAFDVSASGYVNVLQPQDRRSRAPGDSRGTVQARRRLVDAGLDDWLLSEIRAEVEALAPPREGARRVVLDVGCGEGFLLGSLAGERPIEAHGIDLSAPAVDLAARRYPGVEWVVGNADRFLPWADGGFDAIFSVTSRRNGREMARVLAPQGRVLVVVTGEDDLFELREALLGRGTRRDRAAAAVEELGADLGLLSRRAVRRQAWVEGGSLRDLVLATYRGGRRDRDDRVRAMDGMRVTMSRELLLFRAARTELASSRRV